MFQLRQYFSWVLIDQGFSRFLRLSVSLFILSLPSALTYVWLTPTFLSSRRAGIWEATSVRPRPSQTRLGFAPIRAVALDTNPPLLSHLPLPISHATFVICRSLHIPLQSSLSFRTRTRYNVAPVTYCSACTPICLTITRRQCSQQLG